MATARSETTLTALSGCRDRTLDASSWTHMDMEMRCAIRTKSVKNSNMPDGSSASAFLSLSSCAFPVPPASPDAARASVFRALASAARKDLSAEGRLASTTESASTMPISSSSERCDSFAASRSSVAMLNETEKERSEPRDPSAPAVALMVVGTRDVRSISSEVGVLRSILAWQNDSLLVIRRMMLCPIFETKTPGRGGKAVRQRSSSGTHFHHYTGCCFGVSMGHLVEFARCGSHFSVADVIRQLRSLLGPAANDLSACQGMDVEYLKRGFACNHAIRGQMSFMNESKRAPRLNSKYGNKGVVVGVSTCMFFIMSMLSNNARRAPSLDMVSDFWVDSCLRILDTWRWTEDPPPQDALSALDAERRAIKRAVLGIRVGRQKVKELVLDAREGAKLIVSYMRNAIWPRGHTIDAASQPELCEWIFSPEFVTSASMPPPPSTWYQHSTNVPLSALPTIPSVSAVDSDSGSDCGAGSCGSSSVPSWSSGSSVGSADGHGPTVSIDTALAMSNLAAHFR